MQSSPANSISSTVGDPTYGSPAGRRDWRSMLLSLIIHGLAVVLLVLFVSVPGRGTGDEGPRKASIVLAIDNESETEYFDEEKVVEKEEAKTAEQPVSAATAAASAPPSLDLKLLEQPGIRPIINDASLDANQMTKPNTAQAKKEYELTADDLKMIARDQKALRKRQPKGNPASLNVFGLRGLTGRRFVFVIDRSKSMGSQGLGVIDMAIAELGAAVNELKPNHSFQVVAYHERTVTISERELLPATDANKAELPKFLQSLAAFGATSHENGLFAGLAFRPDVLVLLTDGGHPELSGAELNYFKKMAKGQTEIHCLQFGYGGNQEQNNFMMKLARENGGSYRWIDVNKWDADNK